MLLSSSVLLLPAVPAVVRFVIIVKLQLSGVVVGIVIYLGIMVLNSFLIHQSGDFLSRTRQRASDSGGESM